MKDPEKRSYEWNILKKEVTKWKVQKKKLRMKEYLKKKSYEEKKTKKKLRKKEYLKKFRRKG